MFDGPLASLASLAPRRIPTDGLGVLPQKQTKLKVQLKLAIARLRMVQQRDEQLGKTHRRAMAQLLEAGKVDSATIRVENIIRSDITSELHEILELYCELLLARAGLMDGVGPCDPGLEEAVRSIVYAAPKTEIKELAVVRSLLAERYGKEFVLDSMENKGGGLVNDKVVRKLSVEPPRKELVQGYLEEIAKAYGVDWPKRAPEEVAPPPAFVDDEGQNGDGQADDNDNDDDDGGDGGGTREAPIPAEQATPAKRLNRGPSSPLTVTPPRMTTDNIHPKVTLDKVELKPNKKKTEDGAAANEPGRKKNEPEGSVPDLGDLERRFAALKKR